MLPLPVAPKRN